MREIFDTLSQDIRFYHQLYFPGREQSLASRAKLVFRSRGLFLLAVHRLTHAHGRARSEGSSGWAIRILSGMGSYLSKVLTKSDILPSTIIEPGIYLSDLGHIIIGAHSIGGGTLIHSRVTIGMNLNDSGIPQIGRNVWIGNNCVIFGNITIEDGVTIMPNTVLTKTIPSNAVVQGNPGRIIRRNFDNRALRQKLSTDIVPIVEKSNPGSISDV